MKYIDWLTQWLENYIRPSVKVRTYERYHLIIEQHIKDRIGNIELDALSPLVLQKFISELLQNGNRKTGKGLSANSVNAVISVIQGSLRTAHLLGLSKEYTADKLKRPKLKEKPVECFTMSEQKQIEQSILNGKKDKMYGILLCLYSGLRIGELIALQWSDIDFVKGILTVSKSCHDGQDGLIIDEPKTANSRRLIPLPKQLLPILKGIKKKSSSPFVVSANESSVSVRSYQRSFELLLKRLNIPHKGFHSLRHTFATRALECGMDIKTLAEILGHKNPTVTLNRYAHSLMEHKSDMMNRLGKLL
jgi:phage integrase family site specific recombinase